MATLTQPLPPKPDASIPVVMADGRMNQDWYRYFTRLDALIRALRLEIP